MRSCIDKNGDVVAVGIALSVVANIRGIDFSDYDYILFDEFIPSDGERPIKREFEAFLNFYETVNRNRELEGKPAVKCFLIRASFLSTVTPAQLPTFSLRPVRALYMVVLPELGLPAKAILILYILQIR